MKNKLYKIYDKVGIKSDRTKNISKHVLLSFIYKGGSMLASFLLVPLTISFLNMENYGIWLTISSFIGWFAFFDIGLGNGLRNKFAEAKANGDMTLARGYVSVAYFTIGAVCVGLILFFFVLNIFIDWTKVFNTSASLQKDLRILMPIVFGFFCLQLVVKLITTIYTADQHHSMQGKINFFIQAGSLLLIWIMTKTSESSLLIFGTIFSVFPVLILVWFNLFAFNTRYKAFKPTVSLWKKEYLKDIFGLGFNFFILQIGAMILFSTDNFIIIQLFGPAAVVPYNIAFKYFSIIIMIYSIVITPYWSSFTDAYNRNDFNWIKKSVQNIQKLWLLIPITLIIMLLMANWFYNFWLGTKVKVPISLSISMAVYVLVFSYNMIYVNFINGVGKLKAQLWLSFLVIILNIPLSIILATYFQLGVPGIIYGNSFLFLISNLVLPLQYKKIINGTARGIWDK
ncbi:O-antigen/teichoic acid export membrane protein [Flavobacterium sp. CG_23.5]|uniref:lipopolysaccharide biosynthesis protein n=1 Tax=unclassified Flavobacterium TaxID=196869 RepID=UPI0018C97C49|nr:MULTISPECIES: lipopolysaccharide biosynthesis protein [unclassified Flavobacterium]MBG6109887.1 O-antigen/teichoic acid export membrane protein [Flavobacterium sp. CG_9.10]MBP2283129.1 O-antigen/teichoic acid export membrane protein [Flavobacterium sp. CG_23.5]